MFTSWWFITIIDYCPYHKCHCKWYLQLKEKKKGVGYCCYDSKVHVCIFGG